MFFVLKKQEKYGRINIMMKKNGEKNEIIYMDKRKSKKRRKTKGN